MQLTKFEFVYTSLKHPVYIYVKGMNKNIYMCVHLFQNLGLQWAVLLQQLCKIGANASIKCTHWKRMGP